MQRKATKLLTGLCIFYTLFCMLGYFGVAFITVSFLWGDMKLLHRLIYNDIRIIFLTISAIWHMQLPVDGSSHSIKLSKSHITSQTRSNFFPTCNTRVVDVWNILPQSVVEAQSINYYEEPIRYYYYYSNKCLLLTFDL